MRAQHSANYPPLVSREQIGNTIRKALRLYVGRGKQFSVKELSNGTGVKDRVIECAMEAPDSPDYRPLPLEALASIMQFMGSHFANDVLGSIGMGAFDLPDAAIDPHELAATSAENNARIARAAADGKIDADEARNLRSAGESMIESGQAVVAFAGRAA